MEHGVLRIELLSLHTTSLELLPHRQLLGLPLTIDLLSLLLMICHEASPLLQSISLLLNHRLLMVQLEL